MTLQTEYGCTKIKEIRKALDELERTLRVIDGTETTKNNPKVTIADIVIGVAKSQLGIKELTGHNDGPEIKKYQENQVGLAGQPWCASFVSWCYKEAYKQEGSNRPWPHWAGAANYTKTGIENKYFEKVKTPQKGDLFVVNLNATSTYADHIGFIWSVTDRSFLSVEGNSHDAVESRARVIGDAQYTYLRCTRNI